MIKLILQHDGTKYNTALARKLEDLLEHHFGYETEQVISADLGPLKLYNAETLIELGQFEGMPSKEILKFYLFLNA